MAAASVKSKGGKGAEVNRVEWAFTNSTGIFRSFRLERENRNTSKDFYLFSETFRFNELYHLNFQSEFSVFVDKW